SSVGWLRGDGTIEWGDFLEFGEGLLPKIAANDEGICMVCYTGIDAESDVLYCQIGTADLRESVMTFGAPVAIGKETLGNIALGAQGRCFVITVDAGQVFI